MLVMVVFFIAFRWIHLSTPLIRLFLLVLILLLMPDRKSGSAGMPRPISYAVSCYPYLPPFFPYTTLFRSLTSVTPASSAPVLQTPKATSSTLYFDSLTVNAGNGGFLHCIQMDTSVNAANQVVSVGADIAFDADPKFFACLVRFESS